MTFSPLSESDRFSLLRLTMVPLLDRLIDRVVGYRGQTRAAIIAVRDLYRDAVAASDPRWLLATNECRAIASFTSCYVSHAVLRSARYAASLACDCSFGCAISEAARIVHDISDGDERLQQARDLATACRQFGINLAPCPVAPAVAVTLAAYPGRLDQKTWHCGTTHCHAGHLVNESGPTAYAVEAVFGTAWVAAAIAVSELPDEPLPDFGPNANRDVVLADIQRRGALVAARG